MNIPKDYKTEDFIRQPTTLKIEGGTGFSTPFITAALAITKRKENVIVHKIKTFSALISNVEFKNGFDEYFKEYLQ